MGKVQLLSDDLINKIAAGEVVERPASVVKELVENAIDAGATRVDVVVERGGKRLIRVSDNGCGMSREDALMALKRHATSKIRSEKDLFHILTMGFRGEAIPSIASVSRFSMETREEEAEVGVKVEVEGGKEAVVSSAARAVGTTMEVRDLFFNLPARCKFLKSDGTEYSHIAEAVTRLSMANPEIRFRLTHNQRVQLQAHPTSDHRERVASLLGRQVGQAMYPFAFETSWIKFKGLFSRPDVSAQGMKGIYFFVNGRFIRHRGFSHACQEAYRGTLEKGRYPYIVMKIDIAPEMIDVNVHPQKIEVRFQRENEIYSRILATLRSALARTPWVAPMRPRERGEEGERDAASPSAVVSDPERVEEGAPAHPSASPSAMRREPQAPSVGAALTRETPTVTAQSKGQSNAPSMHEQDRHVDTVPSWTPSSSMVSGGKETSQPEAQEEVKPSAPRSFQEFQQRFREAAQSQNLVGAVEEAPAAKLPPLPSAQNNLPFLPGWDPNPGSTRLEGESSVPRDRSVGGSSAPEQAPNPRRSTFFSSLRYMGQFAQMYLLFEKHDNLICIDQHAAHERIAYQRLLQSFELSKVPQQRFLIPPRLELGLVDAQRAEQFQEELGRLGLELEPFGGQSFALKAIPDILKKGDARALVVDVLEELASGKQTASLDQRRDEVLMRMACHGSVRGPHKLTADEVKALMEQLDQIDFKANCPHGRPIFFEIPKGELEKRFHRT